MGGCRKNAFLQNKEIIEQKIYLFLWRPAISVFKCPKNSSHQGTTGF
jgi:hypothetical protein